MFDGEEIERLKQLLGQSDNQSAFSRLYHLYFTRLLRFAISLVRSAAIAEEIVLDVFLHIWKIRQDLTGITHLTIYLFTCVRNRALNHLGKKKLAVFTVDDSLLEVAATSPDPEETYISAEIMDTLEQAIETLPQKCKMIFRLVREEGLKYREVAELLDISQKTVEAQIGIATKKLVLALESSDHLHKISSLRVVS